MDAHTLELLEFDKLRELLASYAGTSLGRELARQIEPYKLIEQVEAEQQLVTEMRLALEADQPPPLSGFHDVRLVVRRAAIGAMLSADQLLAVADTLNCTGAIYRYRMRLEERLHGLIEMLAGVEDMGSLGKSIGGCIDGRGHLLDMASPQLTDIRQKLFELDEKVKGEIKRLLRDPELRRMLSYPNATVSGDHHVLPVSANYRHKFPGVIHRVSSSGETLFIEPVSVANLSSQRITLKAEEDREVKRILRRLTTEVGRYAKPLNYALEVIGKLDLITAKAKLSRDYKMVPPTLNRDGKVWLRQARHPLLEHLFRTTPSANGDGVRQVVPIDLRLGIGFNMLIITGPNTGGKTVTLKTTGLLALMAQSGMHVPAEPGSTMPIFDQILADIGDEQSLEQSLSTFSSHVSRIATIFRTATQHSLILLDELGAGTDPTEGAALGRGILDQIDTIGARAIITTHLGDLKTYAFQNDRAENGAVEFDIQTLRPTYKLLIGQFGMSNALRIARRFKLPPKVLNRARRYLQRRKGKSNELLKLQELREEAEKAKLVALQAEHEAESKRKDFEAKMAELEKKSQEEADLQKKRLNLKANDKVMVSRFGKVGTVVRLNLAKQTVLVSVGLGQWEIPMDEIFPESK